MGWATEIMCVEVIRTYIGQRFFLDAFLDFQEVIGIVIAPPGKRINEESVPMWWVACCDTYPARSEGCLYTVPTCGTVSP